MDMANGCNILLLRRWHIEVVYEDIWEAPPEKVVDGGKSFASAPWGASPRTCLAKMVEDSLYTE